MQQEAWPNGQTSILKSTKPNPNNVLNSTGQSKGKLFPQKKRCARAQKSRTLAMLTFIRDTNSLIY